MKSHHSLCPWRHVAYTDSCGTCDAIRAAIAEEREACAVIAESPDTPYRRVYETYDLPDAIRGGIATTIRARRQA